MNYWQCFTMILMTTSLTACQSQTEQTPAPRQAANQLAVATQTVPAPNRQASTPSPASSAIPPGQTVSADLSVLNKCKICHSLGAKAKVGPGLGKGNGIPGVFGRKAGTFPGFKYKFTQYIKPGKAWVWDKAHLRRWDCDSKKAIKVFTGDAKARTKMPPQRICDPSKQDAVIAALTSL
ncbi:MAG: hypothetical protein Q9M27_03295 [Mariprofundaceae bacterium]|nr:hypothetical protein [Mariprofundaceae bacterium]